jgi:DNA-directed RNA polymerase subunit RPC12/RpoP
MKFPSFGKKYKCAICGKKFKTEEEMEDHRRKVHATTTR